MRALVDSQQRRRHRDIDIFARAGLGAAMERGEDRDHRLKPRIDVGVREAVGALRGQRLAIVAEAVRGEPRFGLHRGRVGHARPPGSALARSEELTSELQSLMRISYAVLCLKK